MPDPRLDLPLRTAADTAGDVQRVLGKLEASQKNLKVIRVLANSPSAFRPFVLMADGLLNRSPLPASVREVVILHLAGHLGVNYEWEEHVPMSEAAGVSKEQREALRDGTLDDLSLFSDEQQLALRATDEIVDQRALSEESWQKACEMWDVEAALDLVLTVGWWGAFVPTIIQAVGLQDPN
ncbi:MAG: 4-carboxymuconolactone decarboxylase [Acidimicrobiaceae bacterium]|jgi:alkylhydroperoxidase family enzyme|nr:4-carboxymuconolactone decarboxylase [Acidimicrobiaceae bacterium]